MAGAVRMLPVASAPAPAAVFRNVRRSMILPTPTLNQIFRDVSPSPQRSVSDSVECLPAAGTPPPAKLAGFRHIPLAARHINTCPFRKSHPVGVALSGRIIAPLRVRDASACHLIHRPARDIIPPLGGSQVSSYLI